MGLVLSGKTRPIRLDDPIRPEHIPDGACVLEGDGLRVDRAVDVLELDRLGVLGLWVKGECVCERAGGVGAEEGVEEAVGGVDGCGCEDDV